MGRPGRELHEGQVFQLAAARREGFKVRRFVVEGHGIGYLALVDQMEPVAGLVGVRHAVDPAEVVQDGGIHCNQKGKQK